jgi:hypothetical protein
MQVQISNGSAWNTIKQIQISDGINWNTVKAGYISDGVNWKQFFSLGGYYVIDNTQNPGLPYNVSIIDNGNNTFYASWTTGGNTSYYNYSFTGIPLSNNTLNTYTPNQSFSSTATKTISVNAINTSHVATVYWSVISGASSYTITYTVNGGSPNTYTTAGSSGGTGILYTNLSSYSAGDVINVTSVVSNNSVSIPASGATSVTFGSDPVSAVATGSGTVTYHASVYPGAFTYNISDATAQPFWFNGAGISISGSSNNIMTVSWNAASNGTSYGDQVFGVYNSFLYITGTNLSDTWPYTSSGNENATVYVYNNNCLFQIYWGTSTNASSYSYTYTISGSNSVTSVTSNTYAIISASAGQTITVNSVTAYIGANATGLSTPGTAGSTTNVTLAVKSNSASSNNFYLTYTQPFVVPTFSPNPPSINWHSTQGTGVYPNWTTTGTGQGWNWETVTASGSTAGSVSYNWQIGTTSSGGTITSGNTSGTVLNTGITATRWARVQAQVTGTDLQTYLGAWTNWT